MSSQPLSRRTASEGVADLIRNDIRSGVLRPGERLRQSDIAARYGVSTTPVREAFALLQAQGVLRVDPHRGAIVFRPTVEDLTESYEIRGALEVLAVDKAVDHLSEKDLQDLQSLVDKMRVTEDPEEWMRLNSDFHLRIYGSVDLPRLTRMIEELRHAAEPYIRLLVTHQDADHRANDEHQAILDACRSRDHARARKAMEAHIASTIEHLLKFMSARDHDTIWAI